MPDPQSEKARLLDACLHALQATLDQTPLIIMVDDLHWADSLTLETILYCLTGLQAHPILFVGAYRSDEITSGHPLRARLGSLILYAR